MVEQMQDDFFGLSIGERLQKARKAKKKDIADVANDLCINASHLTYLEQDKFDKLPAAYVIGFLRTYSDYLSLDTEEMVKEVKNKAELFEDEHFKAIMPQVEAKTPRKKVVWPLIAAVVAVLVVISAVLMFDKKEALDVPITQDLTIEKIEEPEVTKAQEEVAEVEPVKDEVAKKEVIATEKEMAKATESESGITLPPVEVVVEGPDFVNEKPQGARVLLTAKNKDVWFQIKHLGRDRVYVSRILKAGEAYWVKPWRGVYIDVGLPQELDVKIDGTDVGVIGVSGKRVRELSLNAEYLKRMYFGEKQHLDKTKDIPRTKEQLDIYAQRAAEQAEKEAAEAQETPETADVQ